MIARRKITKLDALAETVPKPRGAVPKFGLPKWKTMSLDHKIPMIPAPRGAYNLARRKVGRKLWIRRARMEFDLSDPFCHETYFPYEPLHDEHLLKFFSKPANIEHLLKANLITDGMDAKCSLRDYNTYRRYLRRVHVDCIKRELRRQNRLFVEERTIRYVENQAQKDARRLEEEEKLIGIRQHNAQQKLIQKESKIREQREKTRKTAQRLKLLSLVRQEDRRLVHIKREKQAEQIRQKCKAAAKVARRRVIDISVKWRKKEKARMKAKYQQFVDNEQEKRKTVEERWNKKQNMQKKEMVKQKILLQHINTCRQQFIEYYNNMIKKDIARMQSKTARKYYK